MDRGFLENAINWIYGELERLPKPPPLIIPRHALEMYGDHVPDVINRMVDDEERHWFSYPPMPDFNRLTTPQLSELYAALVKTRANIAAGDIYKPTAYMMIKLCELMPKGSGPGPLRASSYTEEFYKAVTECVEQHGPRSLRNQIVENGIKAQQIKGGDRHQLYFEGTLLMELFEASTPLPLPRKERLAHTHIIAGSGAGKTTLLKNLIAYDLKSADQPSLIIMDPQRALLPEVARLKLDRRVLLIDPEDAEHPPAINIFAVKNASSETEREKTERAVAEMLSDIFAMEKTALTGKQDNVFLYICKMMLQLPKTLGYTATILDVFKFLTDRTPYQRAIDSLDEFGRAFFHEFGEKGSKPYRDTPAQLRTRLYNLLAQNQFRRLFASPETKLDIQAEMDRGSIILIDTAVHHLGDKAAAIYGKVFVKMVLEAARQRWSIPEEQRKDTFFYIDEAEAYLGEDVRVMLRDVRKYKVGCILAHQDYGVVSEAMKSGLSASTSVKIAAKVGAADEGSVAAGLRSTPAFLRGLRQHHFAVYVDGMATAVAATANPDPFNGFNRMTDREYEAFIAQNRRNVSYQPEVRQSPAGPPPMSDEY